MQPYKNGRDNVGEPGGYCAKWNKPHKMSNTVLSQLYLESNNIEILKAE